MTICLRSFPLRLNNSWSKAYLNLGITGVFSNKPQQWTQALAWHHPTVLGVKMPESILVDNHHFSRNLSSHHRLSFLSCNRLSWALNNLQNKISLIFYILTLFLSNVLRLTGNKRERRGLLVKTCPQILATHFGLRISGINGQFLRTGRLVYLQWPGQVSSPLCYGF